MSPSVPKSGSWSTAARQKRKAQPKQPVVRKPLPKSKKPIKRCITKLATRRKFKADWGDGKRTRRFPDGEVLRRAREKQLERLSRPTEGENALAAILTRLAVGYEREKIVQNGDNFILLDFFLGKWKLVLEVDGSAHDSQRQYDHERSIWLAKTKGWNVMRSSNREVFNGQAEQRLRVALGL